MTILQSARDEIKNKKPGELVNLDDYSFFDTDMEELAQLLRLNKHTKVSIRASNITNVGAAILAKCTDLVYLLLDENSVGDKGVEALLTLPNLRELHICTNDLSDIGANLIKDKCGSSFRANVYGNIGVTKTLMREIDAKWAEYKSDAIKSSSQPKGSGYSPRQWQAAGDSSASSSSASSAEDMTRTASDSPKQVTGKSSSK